MVWFGNISVNTLHKRNGGGGGGGGGGCNDNYCCYHWLCHRFVVT
jgi:hypothetical protein